MKKDHGEYRTPMQILFKDKDILTKRPEGMEIEEYKILRRIQTEVMKQLIKRPPSRRISSLMPTRIGYNYHPRAPRESSDLSAAKEAVANKQSI